MSTPQEKRITAYIEPVIRELGYDFVALRIIGSNKLQTLQIMAEHPETQNLDLEGCTKISRAVSAILDVEDPFAGAYQLEVSSPGIDRPLVRPRDYIGSIGFEASVETDEPAENGQKKYRGRIVSYENDTLVLDTDNGTVSLDSANINKAKLVMTDELLKASQLKRKQQIDNEKGD